MMLIIIMIKVRIKPNVTKAYWVKKKKVPFCSSQLRNDQLLRMCHSSLDKCPSEDNYSATALICIGFCCCFLKIVEPVYTWLMLFLFFFHSQRILETDPEHHHVSNFHVLSLLTCFSSRAGSIHVWTWTFYVWVSNTNGLCNYEQMDECYEATVSFSKLFIFTPVSTCKIHRYVWLCVCVIENQDCFVCVFVRWKTRAVLFLNGHFSYKTCFWYSYQSLR